MFREFSSVESRKAKKLANINLKRAPDDQEYGRVQDYFMTEQSMRVGFTRMFGRCDVFAKLLYMKASGLKENCKLSFHDFYKLFIPLWVSFTKFIIYLVRRIRR